MAILNCTCKNAGQDALHGAGRRVMNETAKENTFRCTSCGYEKSVAKTLSKSEQKALAREEAIKKAEDKAKAKAKAK